MAQAGRMNPKSFFGEVKRRNVYKVAVAYAVVAWLVTQIATQVFPFLEIPNWVVRLVIALVVIGFPVALIIAWAFEATPEGIKRTEVADVMPATTSHKKRAWIYVVVVGAAFSIGLFFIGRYTAGNATPRQSEAATAPAKTIADTLQAKLSGSEKNAISKKPTANPEAYELYLKGRFFWNKRTGADLKRAIDYFNQAIAKDPNYALAYAGLADSYTLLSVFSAASPQDSIPQARVAAKKALELDNTLAEAHASSGRILSGYDYDFERAIAEFERAIQLNPNYATSYHWISNGPLTARGEFDRAITEGKRAVELDPLSMIDNADLGQIYFYARRYDEAISQVGKAIEIDPHSYLAHYYLGQIYQLQGHLTEAIAEYQKAVELDDDPQALAFLGQAQARIGQHDEAQKILSRMTEDAKSRYVSAYSFALMFIALGDKERAIDALERAYREGAANDIITIKVDPMLDSLHGDPRFEALAEKIVPARLFTTKSK